MARQWEQRSKFLKKIGPSLDCMIKLGALRLLLEWENTIISYRIDKFKSSRMKEVKSEFQLVTIGCRHRGLQICQTQALRICSPRDRIFISYFLFNKSILILLRFDTEWIIFLQIISLSISKKLKSNILCNMRFMRSLLKKNSGYIGKFLVLVYACYDNCLCYLIVLYILQFWALHGIKSFEFHVLMGSNSIFSPDIRIIRCLLATCRSILLLLHRTLAPIQSRCFSTQSHVNASKTLFWNACIV